MKRHFFRRLCAFLLSLILLFSASLTLIGCSARDEEDTQQENTDSSASDNSTDAKDEQVPEDSTEIFEDWREKVIVFDEKDYGRGTVDFNEIEYKRPDFDAVFTDMELIISNIEKNEISFEKQIEAIKSIEKDYTNIVTMKSLLNIYVAKDSSDEYWNGELSYINSKYPLLLEWIDDMYVAAANSPHATRFEAEYFGLGLIEKYKNGGKYSDAAIEFLKKEEELESAYTTLSTANVEITYNSETDTVDNIIDGYLEKYTGAQTHIEKAVYFVEYYVAKEKCMELYQAKSNELCNEIFIELIRVRRKIADELGYESYAEYAYETLGRNYSYEEASALLDDISEYILPVYYMLSFTSLGKYLVENAPQPTEIELHELINNSYTALNGADEKYGDIYRYMLQHKLYDVDIAKTNRNTGAFEAYINDYNAPYIFMSASGNITDYTTLIHEFGHFTDAFINNNSPTSIDQSEISSQALEYLMLTKMDEVLDDDDEKYLIETSMLNALMTLIIQGFYAKAEEMIYSLPLERITKDELDAQVVAAAKAFSLNTNYFKDVSSIFITHTFVYPFYVQSYCISLLPALEIFFMELESEGSGFAAYSKLVDRSGENLTFEESLADAGITSPFEEGSVYDMALKIRDYLLNGTSYSKKETKNIKAA